MAATTKRSMWVNNRLYTLHSAHLTKEYAQEEVSRIKKRVPGSRTMVRQYRRGPLADPRWAVYSGG